MKIRRLACLARLTLIATVLVIAPAFAESAAPPLGAYNADVNESSISGISSGAFMAVQFGVAWSSIVKGVGVIAGGPFYCAQGTATDAVLGNLGPELTATGPCMKGPPPDLEPLFEKTDEWARRGDIDDPRNIVHQRIYIFAGYTDSIGADGDTNFTPIGTVADPNFADMSLRPASAYSYKVTARLNGDDEDATSPVVTATTLAVPPRCDTPGTCAVPGSNR